MQTVLLIDDDIALTELIEAILEGEGYRVIRAKSGLVALSLLATIAMPDLILLDMRMEGMSGPETLAELADRFPDVLAQVPVVFLSASDHVPSSYQSGFIRKPMDLDKFLVAVKGFIETGVKPNLPVMAMNGASEQLTSSTH